MTGRLRIKGQSLFKMSGEINPQRLSLKMQVGHPTIYRWINKADEVSSIDLEILPAFLIKGIGLTPEQMLQLRLGDIFEYVTDGH